MNDQPNACTIAERKAPLIESNIMELGKCHVMSVTRSLNEFEIKARGLSHRIESWPDSVTHDIERAVTDWQERNPKRGIVLVSSCIQNGCAVIMLHHIEKK